MRYRTSSLLYFSLLLLNACPDKTAATAGLKETTLEGRAPLNLGGTLRVVDPGTGEVVAATQIDEAGIFKVALFDTAGNLTVEAQGGHFIDSVTGKTIRLGDEKIFARVGELRLAETRQLVIGPWTHLAHVAANSSQESYATLLASLVATLTCNHADLADLANADPFRSESLSAGNLDANTLASLHLAAWSQLAANLSLEAHIAPATRITTVTLLQAAAQDLRDGSLDGTDHGAPIYLLDSLALPENLLRTPFAHAIRQTYQKGQSEQHLQTIQDLLRCTTAGASSQFGKTDASLDVSGPRIEVTSPLDGEVLKGATHVDLSLSDDSGLKHISVKLYDSQRAVVATLLDSQVDKAKHKDLHLTLPTPNWPDGHYTLAVEAEDLWGNKSFVQQAFGINNQGGSVTMEISADLGKSIFGVVEIRCRCVDPFLQKCSLSQSSMAYPGIRVLHESEDMLVAQWDTHAVYDQVYTLTCENHSINQNTGTATQAVTVENVGPGHASGTVYLDGPISHVLVQAYTYVDGVKGRLLGSQESENGHFVDLALGADYTGPLLFEAINSASEGGRASFNSGVMQQTVYLSDQKLSLLWDTYRPGDTLAGLSLNAATSIAESLSVALWTHPPQWVEQVQKIDSFETAARVAHRLIAEHIAPDQALDLRHTEVANLDAKLTTANPSHPATLLALFHLGLSRLAAEYSVALNPSMPQAITSAHLTAMLQKDAADGTFDGKDLKGSLLVARKEMSTEVLRLDLARALYRWLRSEPLSSESTHAAEVLPPPQIWASGNFVRQGTGMLTQMAEVVSPLFDFRAGTAFDVEGPQLSVTVTDPQHRLLTQGEPLQVGGTIFIYLRASDMSEMPSLEAFVQDKQLVAREQRRDKPQIEVVTFELDTRQYPNGRLDLSFSGSDGLGNTTEIKSFPLSVDNHRPAPIDDAKEPLWANGARQFSMRTTEPAARCTVQGATEGSDCRILADEQRVLVTLQPFTCEGLHTVVVSAEDFWGTATAVNVDIIVDTAPPLISFVPMPFQQDVDGTVISLEPDKNVNLQKQFHRFDYFDASSVAYNNLPVIRFVAADQANNGMGTHQQAMRVEYQYRYVTAQGERTRAWESVPLGEGDTYQVALSYQSLLPQSLLALTHHEITANNFLAKSQPGDKHYLDVRAIDLAGNATVATFPFELHMSSPPVHVTCNLCEVIEAARLIPAAPDSIHNVGCWVSTVSLTWGRPVPVTSLTPPAQIKLAASEMEATSRVSEIQRQYNRIPRFGSYVEPSCEREPFSLMFDDNGQCVNRNFSWEFPQVVNVSRADFSLKQPLAFSSASGATRDISLSVFGIHHIPIIVNGVNQGSNGPTQPWTSTLGNDGMLHYQFYYRTGWQVYDPGIFQRRMYDKFDERGFIKNLWWTRSPVRMQVIEKDSALPTVPQVILDESCSSTETLFWLEYNAPVLMTRNIAFDY
jgi:hypothetical protein